MTPPNPCDLLLGVRFGEAAEPAPVRHNGLGPSCRRVPQNFNGSAPGVPRNLNSHGSVWWKHCRGSVIALAGILKLGQVRIPDLVPLHTLHASALDQSLASAPESGWRRYASGITCWTACRGDSVGSRSNAGMMSFTDFKAFKSTTTRALSIRPDLPNSPEFIGFPSARSLSLRGCPLHGHIAPRSASTDCYRRPPAGRSQPVSCSCAAPVAPA